MNIKELCKKERIAMKIDNSLDTPLLILKLIFNVPNALVHPSFTRWAMQKKAETPSPPPAAKVG